MKYIKLILLLFSLLLLPWAVNGAWAKDAEITDLRWTARNDGDPPFVRIVTDLTQAVQAEAAIDKAGKKFRSHSEGYKKELQRLSIRYGSARHRFRHSF